MNNLSVTDYASAHLNRIKNKLTLKPIPLNAEYRNNYIALNYKSKKVSFYVSDKKDLNDIKYFLAETFEKEQYGRLNVKNRIVIDVGAAFGDSGIYFALNGAKRVYAYEVSKQAARIAKLNVRKNNLQKRITIINKPCPPLNSINEKIKERMVIKLDCEGCEYPLIGNASSKTFDNIEEIIMEYHQGYRNIVKKLRENNFNCDYDSPTYNNNRKINKKIFFGYLYASKK